MKPQFDAKATFAKIKANRAKLDACPRHAFGELPLYPWGMNQKIVCQRCSGELSMIEAGVYARGFEAAGGNPDEIITNFRGDDVTPVTCPKCKGVCGIETTPNDWHDCDLCEASGTLPRAEALAYIDV